MNQIDLEELLEQCHSPRAKTYLREAIDCYKVNAYRSCVISTWIAVVFDIIDKLRVLGIAGDSQAAAKVREFEDINARRDLDAALAFERQILGMAQNSFEFLSAQEVVEIGRLQEDRNRCAHPNLVREDDIYRPTAELARAHLRQAVELVLRRPPVQGKAALEYLQKEVDSHYFPTMAEDAYETLKRSPVVRAKRALVKEFLFGAIVSCIKESLSPHKTRQRIAAVSAVCRLHSHLAEELLKHGIDGVFGRLDDAVLGRAVYVLHCLPFLIPWLSAPTRQKLNTYVRSMPEDEAINILVWALELDGFSISAEERLKSLTPNPLRSLLSNYSTAGMSVPGNVIDCAISAYEGSNNFNSANERANILIRPILKICDRDQLERVVRAGCHSQVAGSHQFIPLLQEVKCRSVISPADYDRILTEVGVAVYAPHLLYTQPAASAQ